MNKVLVIVVAVLLLASVGRTGAVYMWEDERGVVHLTNDPEAVPAKYKEHVNRRDLPEPRGASYRSTGLSKPVMEEVRDRHGRGRDYWMNRASQARARRYRAEIAYKGLGTEYRQVQDGYKNTTSLANRDRYRKRMEELEVEMRRQREDIRRARELVEIILPAEAMRAGAPAEWLE
jgi:hypothetical protein